MSNLSLFLNACPPRPIAHAGDQYAADIIQGLSEELSSSTNAADFLEATHLTQAAQGFLRMAMDRAALGRSSTSPSVYQLYSRYGGGKTHSLLLLAAAAKYPDLRYWAETAQIEPVSARVVAFDGRKHNVQGADMDNQGSQARSLAGYVLYHLGGAAELEKFKQGDAILSDPGSDVFQRLIGEDPTIIVIDELIHYISRVNQLAAGDSTISTEGVLTTISALVDAVTDSPKAVLVITTPESANELLHETGGATAGGDAFPQDTLALNEMLGRINSQIAREMHAVTPSSETDLPAILRKRLFYSVDDAARKRTASAYADVAARNGRDSDYQRFYDAYPFHPSLLNIITGHLSANRNFQRVRGTLRLMGNTLLEMQESSREAVLVHPYHVTPRVARIRDEVVNRTGFSDLDPAIDRDIVGEKSTVEQIGNALAEPAAVTMLLGTIAPEASSGLYADHIADAILSPEHDDFGVIANAIEQFLNRAIYVDDSPNTQRKRFSKDANIMKELLESSDAIKSNTNTMSGLLRDAIKCAYSGSNRQDELFDVVLFPSRQSNMPDEPDRAVLGIINPDYWNWVDAGNLANGMSNDDLLNLHRHSSGNDGTAPREYPNNALMLAAHDGNLERIRDDIATMEAAEQLLKDTSRSILQYRRDNLKSIHTSAQKAAITGIQNKFTHLFSAGNSPQYQWPIAHRGSHIEHRPLESQTDAVGKGQDVILRSLGDGVLRGTAAGLNKRAWERVYIIAREQGSTLGELRADFARTPDRRIIVSEATWRAMIANAVSNDALHIETLSGEINPTGGYNPDWRAWVKGYEPQVEPEPEPDPVPIPEPVPSPTPYEFNSGSHPGKVAYEEVRRFMDGNGWEWSALVSCEVTGSTAALADQIASIAQGSDSGIAITMRAQGGKIRVDIVDAVPSEFKDYSRSAKRMIARAGISVVDVTVRLDSDAAQRVLDKLNRRDNATIKVLFR